MPNQNDKLTPTQKDVLVDFLLTTKHFFFSEINGLTEKKIAQILVDKIDQLREVFDED